MLHLIKRHFWDLPVFIISINGAFETKKTTEIWAAMSICRSQAFKIGPAGNSFPQLFLNLQSLFCNQILYLQTPELLLLSKTVTLLHLLHLIVQIFVDDLQTVIAVKVNYFHQILKHKIFQGQKSPFKFNWVTTIVDFNKYVISHSVMSLLDELQILKLKISINSVFIVQDYHMFMCPSHQSIRAAHLTKHLISM